MNLIEVITSCLKGNKTYQLFNGRYIIIDDLKVVAELVFHNNLTFLRIESNKIFKPTCFHYKVCYYIDFIFEFKNKFFNLNKEAKQKLIKKLFSKVKTNLNKLKFNNLKGQFELPDENFYLTEELNLLDNDTINTNEENKFDLFIECCVCKENTYSVTICNHTLCVRCREKLIEDVCPLCRKQLYKHDNCNHEINLEIELEDFS
jgi:hypothetical protein